MNTTETTSCRADPVHGRRVAAGMLLMVAALALFGRYLPLNWHEGSPLLLGVAFIVWGALARVRGLLVPGGILTGIGVGNLLRPEYGNGAFLFSMAGGFVLIWLLSLVIFGRKGACSWPFYPAGGLAFAGLAQVGGPDFREWLHLGRPFWPYALIVVALYLLFSRPREQA